eukprot:12404062-Karenia_brevis.AAC.1
MREAPARCGAIWSGASPFSNILVTAASCSRRVPSFAGVKASRKCCTRKPEGPAAESKGKLLSTLPKISTSTSGA